MIFSPNRQYLFFSDDRRSFVSCLAVFKITVEDDLKVSLMGSSRFVTEQHGGLSKVIFHPTYDFIIFRNGTEVGLWHFKRPITTIAVYTPKNFSLEGFKRTDPNAIALSACGRYIIITDETPATVIPIPEEEFVAGNKAN